MTNRGRMAAKLTGVAAAAALVFGVVGPASAATQNVEYRLVSGSGTITLPITDPAPADPIVFGLPDATGITGTWDDATGAFTGTFSSAAYSSSREVSPGVSVTQVVQILAPAGVSGTIDPATGSGQLSATFNVSIYVESLNGTTRVNVQCDITGVPVTYNVTATKDPADSLIFTNLALTSSAPFTVPTPTCANGPGDPGVLPVATVQQGLVDALDLPNSGATSSLSLIAGAVPPPPVTTTTTLPPTTTTTAAPSTTTEPAAAVTATVHFTG